eukprot:SAG11_NODE_7489_length_1137_cov_1.811175_1_plen_127_part_00
MHAEQADRRERTAEAAQQEQWYNYVRELFALMAGAGNLRSATAGHGTTVSRSEAAELATMLGIPVFSHETTMAAMSAVAGIEPVDSVARNGATWHDGGAGERIPFELFFVWFSRLERQHRNLREGR